MLNSCPLLARILPIVYTTLLYSGLSVELMADSRTLLPFVNASSFVRSLLLVVIDVRLNFFAAPFCPGLRDDATPKLTPAALLGIF